MSKSVGQLIITVAMAILAIIMIASAIAFSTYDRIVDAGHVCSFVSVSCDYEKIYATCEKCALAENVDMSFPRIMRGRRISVVVRRESE